MVMKLRPLDVLFLDPGLRECGVSLFDGQTGKLKRAWLSRSEEKTKRGPSAWVAMADQIYLDVMGGRSLSRLVTEYPQVYDPKFQQGDQADIIEVAGVVGAVCGMFGHTDLAYDQVTGFLPRTWKGQTPKEVMLARLKELPYPAGLLPEEWTALEPCPQSLLHNVIDSVALGVWYLKKNGVRK